MRGIKVGAFHVMSCYPLRLPFHVIAGLLCNPKYLRQTARMCEATTLAVRHGKPSNIGQPPYPYGVCSATAPRYALHKSCPSLHYFVMATDTISVVYNWSCHSP